MSVTANSVVYSIALQMVKNIGCTTYKKLIDQFGSAEKIFNSTHLPSSPKVLSSNTLHTIKKEKNVLLETASKVALEHQKRAISVIPYEDKRYPKRLRHIFNPPAVLYTNSSIDLNKNRMIAIVGTRDMTKYGKQFVAQLIAGLARYDATIVSGLAYGVDICAHTHAVSHHLSTIGVVAGGVDVIYPPEHAQEVTAMQALGGGLLSEQPLGVKPEKHLFPVRNRIIAGLVDAVVIVEAGEKSGALITAKFANEFNREVFALPGDIGSTYSKGCNHLIKTHQAHMITNADDLAYIMNWVPKRIPQKRKLRISLNLSKEENCVIEALTAQDILDLDGLAKATDLAPGQLSLLTLQLEMKSLITIIEGCKYSLYRSTSQRIA